MRRFRLITACVDQDIEGRPSAIGKHQFAAPPRAGERLVVYLEGKPRSATVVRVTHDSRPASGDGPEGQPTIGLLVSMDD